jgi:hypothetical protein
MEEFLNDGDFEISICFFYNSDGYFFVGNWKDFPLYVWENFSLQIIELEKIEIINYYK